jgi:hypothetical protein
VKSFGPDRSGLRGARGAQQKLIDGHAERLNIELALVFRIDFDALRQAFADNRPLNIERQLGDRPQIAPLENAQHDEQRRHECEHHADQTKNRHPET